MLSTIHNAQKNNHKIKELRLFDSVLNGKDIQ